MIVPRFEFNRRVRLTAYFLYAALAGLFFETGAWLILTFDDEISRLPGVSGFVQDGLTLDPYEMPSSQGGNHWVLRPGYTVTAKDLHLQKLQSGRVAGARALNLLKNKALKESLFRINSDGFKGPEIDSTHALIRILALGDSTTFGLGSVDYPSSLQTHFNRRGIPAEVINGGVEAYTIKNIFFELDRYKALKPNIVILYIGWNSIFLFPPPKNAFEGLHMVRLGKRVWRFIQRQAVGKRNYAISLYERSPKPDPEIEKLSYIDGYKPFFFEKFKRVVSGLQSTGARIALVTLPGLYTLSRAPTLQEMKIGHLPWYTENPFFLAKLSYEYNKALRRFADRNKLLVIDLEKWADETLQPRQKFFSDSVHLSQEGLELAGAFMAKELTPLLRTMINGAGNSAPGNNPR